MILTTQNNPEKKITTKNTQTHVKKNKQTQEQSESAGDQTKQSARLTQEDKIEDVSILLVEDNLINQRVIRGFLEDLNITIDAVNDATAFGLAGDGGLNTLLIK